MSSKEKVRVQDDAKLAYKGGRCDDYAVDGQRDGSVFIQVGSSTDGEEFSLA